MKNLKPGTSKSSSFYRHKVAELYTNRRGDQFKMQIKLLRPERRCFWGMHPSSRWKVLTLISQTNPGVARLPNHHQSLVGLEQKGLFSVFMVYWVVDEFLFIILTQNWQSLHPLGDAAGHQHILALKASLQATGYIGLLVKTSATSPV